MLIAHAAKRLHDPSTISSLMIRNPLPVRMSTSVQNHALLRDRRHRHGLSDKPPPCQAFSSPSARTQASAYLETFEDGTSPRA